ncbi:MAG: propanediol utilization protein [Paracoccaceae bacterium]
MTPVSAIRVAGHFGELLQGRLGPHGPIALISLPCPVLHVEAQFRPGRGFLLHPASNRVLSPDRARRLLRAIGQSVPGAVGLIATMPVGGGAGSSTAALVALAGVARWQGTASDLARACVSVEGASDPLMFRHAERLLWASRQAEIVGHLPALPRFEVVGGFLGPGQPTDASDDRFPDIADLVRAWGTAALHGDLVAIARLASESADRTLALRHPGPDPIAAIARATGALGHVIAHTGAARGLIFAPGTVPEGVGKHLAGAGIASAIRFRVGGGG